MLRSVVRSALRALAASRRRPAPVLGALAALPLLAAGAQAAPIGFTFQGTVIGATLDLGAQLAGGEAISGTIVLDGAAAGVFTPTPDPVFLRAEMLHAGAVLSTSVTLLGDTVSGSGGDVELFDAVGPLAGDDSYEVTGQLTAGAIGGAAPASFFWNTAYGPAGFTLAAGDPLFAPPALDPGSFNQFTLTSAAGGIAFGSVDAFQIVALPEPSALALGALGLVAVRRRAGAGAGAAACSSRGPARALRICRRQ